MAAPEGAGAKHERSRELLEMALRGIKAMTNSERLDSINNFAANPEEALLAPEGATVWSGPRIWRG